MNAMLGADVEVEVRTRGAVDGATRAYGRDKVAHVARLAPAPVLAARLELGHERNPSIERPATAKASLDVNGRVVRAHVAAATPREAIDVLERRLHARLVRLARRPDASIRRRTPGDAPLHRPTFRELPVGERSIAREKHVALRAMTPEEAAAEAELRDYEWYLFVDHDLGVDALVERGDPASEQIADVSNPITAADAARVLDVEARTRVLFVDRTSHRAAVLYRRFDGNYGLVLGT